MEGQHGVNNAMDAPNFIQIKNPIEPVRLSEWASNRDRECAMERDGYIYNGGKTKKDTTFSCTQLINELS